MANAIGIDFGTSNCCVGVWQNDLVNIIANDQGNRNTPCCVAFTNTEYLIGDTAKNEMYMNPKNTLFSIRRFIGRRYNDEDVQRYLTHFPFTVLNDQGEPKFQVEYKRATRIFTTEQITVEILGKIKVMANKHFGHEVKNAVLTVPAYFNDSQRKIITTVGENANLNVLDIINEPVAAALAYGLDKNVSGERNILIYDLGGGTLDVSILSIAEGSDFRMKSRAGDIHLGGDDFDNRLANHCLGVFKEQFNKDLSVNTRAVIRLRTACERVKKALSFRIEANLEIDALYEGHNLYTTITRVRFEELCMDLFKSTLISVEKALTDANLDKSQVDEVILAGGSTYIPKIQEMLQIFFCGKPLNFSINPSEVVAYGATIHASKLNGSNLQQFTYICICLFIFLSLIYWFN